MTHYEVLGVSPQATPEQIKSAYRARAKSCHPDANAQRSETERQRATEQFKQLNEAHRVLSDPARRSSYDAKLAASAPRIPLPVAANKIIDDLDHRVGAAIQTGEQLLTVGRGFQDALRSFSQVFGKK